MRNAELRTAFRNVAERRYIMPEGYIMLAKQVHHVAKGDTKVGRFAPND